MASWLQRLTRRRATPDALLNEGLGLAMDWGENWLSPINVRLRKLHPYLSFDESLAPIVRGKYSWVDQENLRRLLNQGVYFAAKVGGRAREA